MKLLQNIKEISMSQLRFFPNNEVKKTHWKRNGIQNTVSKMSISPRYNYNAKLKLQTNKLHVEAPIKTFEKQNKKCVPTLFLHCTVLF